MDDFQKLIGIEKKFNKITKLIHENFQSCLRKNMELEIFRNIARLSEEHFQDFQQRREYTCVVENLESHSIRISSGIEEQIQNIQDLKKKNSDQGNFINFIFCVDNILPSLTLKLIGSYLGVS